MKEPEPAAGEKENHVLEMVYQAHQGENFKNGEYFPTTSFQVPTQRLLNE